MNRLLALACTTLASLVTAATVYAQSGVLLPADADQPNPSILSLEEMNVDIVIDNGDARVYVTQIFANHSNKVQEGTYIFALPGESTVSDFAVWDGPVRIPAVILERQRAGEVYDEARAQAIDPGLLEAGERDGSDPKAPSVWNSSTTSGSPSIASQRDFFYRSNPHSMASRPPATFASILPCIPPIPSPASN